MRPVAKWGGTRAVQALAKVRRDGKAAGAPCCLCGQAIDYSLTGGEDACSVQHVKSRLRYPELTWDPMNWAPAHLSCNKRAGTGETLDVGVIPW